MRATTDRLPSSKATIFYPPSILEEELKNRVAVDWFGAFDCSHILGKVDFCAAVPATDLPLCDAESVLWAEAKRGAEAPLDFALVQLILTIGKERTFDKHLPPKYLAAFNSARIAFIPYSEVVEIFYQNDFNWNVAPSDHETREFGDLYQRVIRILESATLEFDFAKDEAELRRFIKTNLNTGRTGCQPVQITKNNFTHIYQRWRETVMPTILMPDWAAAKKNGIIDADFFLADIFSSDNAAVTDRLNVLLMNDHYRQSGGTNALGFQLFSEISFSDGQKAHHLFWNRYRRYYHAQPNANPNASFYDIRLHFQGSTTDAKGKVRMNSESTDEKYTELIGNLRMAMKSLAHRIEPKVYEYGFLKK